MNHQAHAQRDCPCCGDTQAPVHVVGSPQRAEDLPPEALAQHWNGFFKDKVYFSYARCWSCGLLFAPRFFDLPSLEALYAQMAPNMQEVPVAALRRTQGGYFRALKRKARLDGGLIELGPDIGLFTEHCAREGHFTDYWLFEPNRQVEDTLRQALAGQSVHVVHEMSAFDVVPEASASVAVMIHVLDHLLDPVETLKALRERMRPDGHLLIVAHDEQSWLRRLVGWRWPAFCLQHPQIFNRQSIARLLARAGFQVVTHQATVNHFELSFLLKHLLWALGLRVRAVPHFGGLTVGLRLGNMLTIAQPTLGTAGTPWTGH